MRQMSLVALHPKRNLSRRNQMHRVYPYLLPDLDIARSNVERLWRNLKYEEVYLKAYDSVALARTSIRQ